MKRRVLAIPGARSRHINPHCFLLYSQFKRWEVTDAQISTQLLRRHDVVHIHWPDMFWNKKNLLFCLAFSTAFFLLLGWQRLRGAKVVRTIHNIKPHDIPYPKINDLGEWLLRRLTTGYIFLSESSKQIYLQSNPLGRADKSEVIRRGSYRELFPTVPTQKAAREKLGIPPDAKTWLCFGAIRKYKQIPEIITAFQNIAVPEARLIIAGQPKDRDLVADIISLCKGDDRIIIYAENVPEAEIPYFFASCDVVVLAHSDTVNSGVLFLTHDFKKTLLYRENPSFAEILKNLGSAQGLAFRDTLTASDLKNAADQKTLPSPDDKAATWKNIADRTQDFFEELIRLGTSRR